MAKRQPPARRPAKTPSPFESARLRRPPASPHATSSEYLRQTGVLSSATLTKIARAGITTPAAWAARGSAAQLRDDVARKVGAVVEMAAVGAPPKAAGALVKAGVGVLDLALTGRKRATALAKATKLPGAEIDRLVALARHHIGRTASVAGATLAYGIGALPAGFGRPHACDCCDPESSSVSRYAYFQFLASKTGHTLEALDGILFQQFALLSPSNGRLVSPRVAISAMALSRAYPGPLTHDEDFGFLWTMLGALLAMEPLTAAEIATGAAGLTPQVNAAVLEARLAAWLPLPSIPPSAQFSREELAASLAILEARASVRLMETIAREPAFIGSDATTLMREVTARLGAAAEGPRRRAWVFRREAYRRRSGLTPAVLTARFCIDMTAGACETTTRLDQAILSLQRFLDSQRNAATTAEARARASYPSYEEWRATELAGIYPEFGALLRDEVLTSSLDGFDRGSILADAASTRARAETLLARAEAALGTAKVTSSNQYQGTPLADTWMAGHFARGLAAIRGVLAVDDAIRDGVARLDDDQPGLTIAALDDAEARLQAVSELVFTSGSDWRTPSRSSLAALLALPTAERKMRLIVLGSELFLESKPLFDVDFGLAAPAGIDLDTGLFTDLARWTAGPGFRMANPADGPGTDRHVMKDATQQIETVSSLVYADGSSLADYECTATFRLRDAMWTSVDGSGEKLGVVVRVAGSAGYRFVITSGWGPTVYTSAQPVDIPPADTGNDVLDGILDFGAAVVETVLTDDEITGSQSFELHFVLEKVSASGAATEVARDDRVVFVDEGDSCTMTVRAQGQQLSGELRVGGDTYSVSAGGATPGAGSFGVVASRSVSAVIGPVRLSILAASTRPHPPFFASRRTLLPSRYFLSRHELYHAHMHEGAPLNPGLHVDDIVTTSASVTVQPLAVVVENGSHQRLVFDAGSDAVSLDALDALLDEALAMLFYLRFVVLPVRYSAAHALAGDYERAAAYLRVLLDDLAPIGAREVCPCLTDAPAALAPTRGADTRLLCLRLGEIYLAQAEWYFRRDTSADRAEAVRLLDRVFALHERESACDCDAPFARADETLVLLVSAVVQSQGWSADVEAALGERVRRILDLLAEARRVCVEGDEVAAALAQVNPAPATAVAVLTASLAQLESRLQQLVDQARSRLAAGWTDTAVRGRLADLLQQGSVGLASIDSGLIVRPWPGLVGTIWGAASGMCVPVNPAMREQLARACVMRTFLRECRNVLGYKSDFVSDRRFEFLLQTAKGFADLALGAERDLIAFKQTYEAESFSLLSATRQLDVARAAVGIQGMKANEASADVGMATLQMGQAQLAADHYETLLANGLNTWEQVSLASAWASTALSSAAVLPMLGSVALAGVGLATAASGVGAAPGAAMTTIGAAGSLLSAVTGGLSGGASAAGALSNVASMHASFERRAEEWDFQLRSSRFAIAIAGDGVRQAVGRHRIAVAETELARLQLDVARDAARYLSAKSLNAAMWAWMQRVSRQEYRRRLSYAIEAAFMAERALGFELQQPVEAIRFDYFDPQRDGALGATQLLTDIASLEHTRLIERQRKLQMSKTISMATMMPGDLQRFRETGRLPFRTLMSWFDRDFPGHYLRLIKTVRTTVLALVPPNDGIHATLSSNGISRVVVGPPFREQVIRRSPEQAALTAPYNAAGVFVLDYKDEFLLPFEGSGVDMDWIVELPRATNHFDFGTIADVQLTIEYTALANDSHRRRVQRALGTSVSGERALSLARELPDQWYALHHPDQVAQPMRVALDLRPSDYPANLTDARIDHVAVILGAAGGAVPPAIAGVALHLDVDNGSGAMQHIGGVADVVNGVASTRRPPASGGVHGWDGLRGQPAVGALTLELPDLPAVRALFAGGGVADVVLVVTYTAQNAAFL